jgi:formylglycine-generating enzyme required for sulfatase activity
MKKILQVVFGILVILVFAGCPNQNGSGDASTSLSIGDTETVTIGLETLTMIYANNSTSMTFPTESDDSGSSTLTTKFFMGETEVTNAVMATVLQWAYDNGRFSSTVGDHNGLDTTTAKHGGQQLLDLGDVDCRVDYDGSGTFSAETGYENNPVTNVTWYGSVMFCNWLTEMRDGNTDNVVYTNIDTTWADDETTETVTKTGYRLPSSDEWEYTARYRGADSTNTVSGYTSPYYTQGDSASGATADYTNASACQAVAVYSGSSPVPSDEAVVKSLGAGSANSLGLYDMSGNVWEWCFTESGSYRIIRGGSWNHAANHLQVGNVYDDYPDLELSYLGFRLCRTAND